MSKKRLVGLILGILAVLIAGAAAIGIFFFPKEEEPDNSTGKRVELYWNVDREKYVGDSSAGMNSRKRAEDGFFKVCLAVDGEHAEYKVEDARLVHEIDSMDIMGLIFDENGTITDVLDPAEATAGEVASMYYVVFAGDENMTVCEDKSLEGTTESLTFAEDKKIYNVIGTEPVAAKDVAVSGDRIRAFVNEAGEVTHVFIYERVGYWSGSITEEYCAHCKENVEWYDWEEKYTIPSESGHWRLTEDVNLSSQHRIEENEEIIIDLNGKTVTGAENTRVYAMTGENAFLAFTDNSADGTGKVTGHGATDNGGIVLVRYGRFELYGGTLDASAIETDQYATAIRVNKDAVFNMYGGVVIGGKAIGSMNAKETSTTGGYGGTIQVAGTFNLYDGTIRDGIVTKYQKKDGDFTCGNGGNIHIGTSGIFNMYGGQVLNGKADRAGGNIYIGKEAVIHISGGSISGGIVTAENGSGGNIYISSTSTLNLENAFVEQGASQGHGGNISVYGTLNLISGTVTKGSAMQYAGSVYVNGTVNMTGGKISDGTSEKRGGNVFVGQTGEFTLKNGEVLNGIAAERGGNFEVTGKLNIEDGLVSGGKAKNGGNVCMAGTFQMSGGTIKDGEVTNTTQYDRNVFVVQSKEGQTFTMSGGTIAGGVRIKTTYGTTLTKKACITNDSGYTNLTIDKNDENQPIVSIADLEEGAKIGVNPKSVSPFATNVAAENLKYITSDDSEYEIERDEDGNLSFMHMWISNNSLPTKSGYYKLATDIVISKAYVTAENSNIEIDLNGKTISVDTSSNDGSGVRIYVTGKGSTLTITDTSKDAAGKIEGFRGTYGTAGMIYLKGENSVVNLYAGTIDAANVAFDAQKDKGTGAAVYAENGSVFNMYGGTVIGGTAYNGGSVYVKDTAVFNMHGGEVKGGTATNRGGNVYIEEGGTFYLVDGIVSGGTAKNAGNVNVVGTFNMSGGTIKDGTVTNSTAYDTNVFIVQEAQGNTFTMSGGTIAGGVRIKSTCGAVLTGTAKITNIAVDSKEASVTIGDLAEGAEIGINPSCFGLEYFAADVVEADKEFMTVDGGGYAFELVDNNKFMLIKLINEGDGLPTQSGYYRLAEDISIAEAYTIKENAQITLDLNGKTITQSANARIYVTGNDSTLNIIDTSETGSGKIVAQRTTYGTAGSLYLKGTNSVVNLYAGTIDASNVTFVDPDKGTGAAVYAENGSVFSMYGGTVIGGTAYNGGSVYVKDTAIFNMRGGEVKGGTATNRGGNVYIEEGGTFNLVDGIVSGGTAANAGNINVVGNFSMSGGTIKDGTVTNSTKYDADVFIVQETEGNIFIISGGTIAGGVRIKSTCGAVLTGTAKITNIAVDSKEAAVTIGDLAEGAEIGINPSCFGLEYFAADVVEADKEFMTVDGGGYAFELVDNNKFMLIKLINEGDGLPTQSGYYRLAEDISIAQAYTIEADAQITLDLNGKTITQSANARIYVTGNNSTLNIIDTSETGSGKIVAQRTTYGTAGSLYLKGTDSIVNLYAGTIDASNVTFVDPDKGTGAAVYAEDGSVFNMYGGTVIGGTAYNGGSVYVKDTAVFNMRGGEVKGGTAANRGGNVYIEEGGTFNLYDGTISGGNAKNAGNVNVAGSFNMSGGTVKAGEVTNSSAYDRNVFIVQETEGNTFTMSGGTIAGGVRIKSTCGTTLTGTAKITNESGYTNLTLDTSDVIVSIGDLQEGAKIGVNPQYTDTHFATDAKESDLAYITADNSEYAVGLKDEDKLVLVNLWTSTSSLPTASGYYRLTDDVTITGAYVTAADSVIELDLNGKSVIVGGNVRVYVTGDNSTLNITDTSAESKGTIVSSRTDYNAKGGMIYLKGDNSVVNLYNGTLDASNIAIRSGSTAAMGAAAYVESSASFNMYGGEIKGGTAYNGGNIYVEGSAEFHMYGGKVTDGTATNHGGNIYVAASAILTLDEGEITDGEAKQGGNVYVKADAGTLNIHGGKITGGNASTGGNIAALGVFNMTAGEISGGTGANTGSNVFTKPGTDGCTFTMSGGTIVGLVKVNTAGTIVLEGDAKITQGTYTDGSTTIYCGIHIAKTGIILDTTELLDGAEIYLYAAAQTTVSVTGMEMELYNGFFKPSDGMELLFGDDSITINPQG